MNRRELFAAGLPLALVAGVARAEETPHAGADAPAAAWEGSSARATPAASARGRPAAKSSLRFRTVSLEGSMRPSCTCSGINANYFALRRWHADHQTRRTNGADARGGVCGGGGPAGRETAGRGIDGGDRRARGRGGDQPLPPLGRRADLVDGGRGRTADAGLAAARHRFAPGRSHRLGPSVAAGLADPAGSTFFRVYVATAPTSRDENPGRAQALGRRIEQIDAMLDRARVRGETAPHVFEVTDHLLGPIYMRALFGVPADEKTAEGLVAFLLNAVAARGP